MGQTRQMGLVRLVAQHAPGATLAIVVASFFINLLVLVSPLYMLQVYDRVLPSRSTETLLLLTIAIAALLAVMAMLERARSRILARISVRVAVDMSAKAFDAVFRRNLRRPGGGASNRSAGDVELVRQFLAGPGVPAFIDLPWAPLFIAAAYLMSPLIGHLTLGAAILLFALTVISEAVSRKPLKFSAYHGAKAAGFAETSLANAQTISAMGMLPAIRGRWFAALERSLAYSAQVAERAATLSSMSRFLRVAVQSIVLGAGAWLAIEQLITPGTMIAGSIILGRGLAPIEQVVGAWRSFVAARDAHSRLTALLAENPPPKTGGVTLPPPAGAVILEGAVVMAPEGGTAILKGIGMRIPAGQALGVIGPSGAGKSTLARLIVGAVAADRGTVRIDGAAMQDWPSEVLGRHVGYLPQEVELFDGTVAENIARFGELDSEKIVRAAKLAGVHELVLQLPQGYETTIGAVGRGLSGGQRQRIALARALYDDPVLVVLDEPNANLDSDGEVALVNVIRQLRLRRATVILVSHRISLIALTERVLAMRDGGVELHGTAEEVIAKLQGKAPPAPQHPPQAPRAIEGSRS